MRKAIIFSLIMFFLFTIHSFAVEPVNLKFATMDPVQAPPVAHAYKPWIDKINKASGGTLDIQIYGGGSLGRNPRVQLKLVKDGVADLAFIVPSYTPGQFPDDEIFGVPFMATNGYESAMAAQRMYERGLLRGYEDVVLLGLYTTDINALQSTFPIRTPKDMEGCKVRAVNKIQNDLAKRLKAVGIGMPGPQIAENMSRGIINASFLDNSALFTFRVAGVAKHHLLVPFGATTLGVVMNKQKYESLPPQAKRALDEHGSDISKMWISAILADVKNGMAKISADPSHTIVTPSNEELKLWKDAVQPVIDDWIAANPRRKMLVKAYQEELDRIRN